MPLPARHWTLLLSLIAQAPSGRGAVEPHMLTLQGDLSPVHDPAIIKEQNTWYLFTTGPARPGHIPIRCSTDLHTWTKCGHVFDELPAWVHEQVWLATSLWAPDISHENGEFRLYYAASSFGRNESAIGLATTKTLDQHSPDYKWVDKGMVLQSHAGQDDWNAIDPNLVSDRDGREWLVFGSFWGGIKMRELDPSTGKLLTGNSKLYSLAERPHQGMNDPIEAPFLISHGDSYYLFVSFDFCCRGAKSTYNVVAGRAREITGPYVDEDGKPLLEGGGTRIIAGSNKWHGPGHEAVLLGGPEDLFVFHAYDGVSGKPFLQISTMVWENGWPRVAAFADQEKGNSEPHPVAAAAGRQTS